MALIKCDIHREIRQKPAGIMNVSLWRKRNFHSVQIQKVLKFHIDKKKDLEKKTKRSKSANINFLGSNTDSNIAIQQKTYIDKTFFRNYGWVIHHAEKLKRIRNFWLVRLIAHYAVLNEFSDFLQETKDHS